MAARRSHAPAWRYLGTGVTRLFYVCLKGKPVPQARARTTKRGTFYPKASAEYRKALTWAMRSADNWAHGTDDARLTGPLRVDVEVAGARANSDLDNYAKMALDALQDAGVIASDDVRTITELRVRVADGEPRMTLALHAGAAQGRKTK